MRKISRLLVILSVMMNFSWAAASCPDSSPTGEVRIVGSLEEAAGGPPGLAVLVFFSLDCPVCWEELFEVRYIVEKNSVPIALIGISADSREDLEPFLAKHAFFYPTVSDQGHALFRRFKVKLEPLVVVIDAGKVIHRDSTAESFDRRREKLKRCLLEISEKRPS